MIDEGKAKIGAEMADIVNSTSTMLEARAGDFAGRLEQPATSSSRAFDADIQRLAEARAGIDEAVEDHGAQARRGPRPHGGRALHADLQKFAEGRAVDRRRRRPACAKAVGRPQPWSPSAVEEDLRKITEARASIDAALGSQLERLDAGRENLARALSEDLQKLDQTGRRSTRWWQATSASSPKAATS